MGADEVPCPYAKTCITQLHHFCKRRNSPKVYNWPSWKHSSILSMMPLRYAFPLRYFLSTCRALAYLRKTRRQDNKAPLRRGCEGSPTYTTRNTRLKDRRPIIYLPKAELLHGHFGHLHARFTGEKGRGKRHGIMTSYPD